tara:strand:- start:2887 stop:4923 length:2037 start_codon:yes stop_codon:yes gene_type:complete
MNHLHFNELTFKAEGSTEEVEYYVEGFLSDMSPDLVGDRVYCQDSLVKQLNELAQANKVTLHHDRAESTIAGVCVGAELKDGRAYVTTKLNRHHPDFEKTWYEIQQGFIDGYSIEYEVVNGKENEHGGLDLYDINLFGYGLASRAVNPRASITDSYSKEKVYIPIFNKEETNMTEETKALPIEEVKVKEEAPVEAEAEEKPEEAPTPEAEEEPAPEPEVEAEPEAEQAEEVAEPEEKEIVLTDVEVKEINQKRQEKEVDSMVSSILGNAKFKEAIDKIEVKEKVIKNEAPEPKENLIVKEYKEAFKMESKVSIKEQLNTAKKVAEKQGLYAKAFTMGTTPVEFREDFNFKSGGPNDSELQVKELNVKALETDTNSTSYTQSGAELNDVYQPVIFNMLNDRTTFFGLLPKDDFSQYQKVQWRARNARNSSAGAYGEGDAIVKGNTTRQKLETKFAYYAVGVQVTGQMVAASRGSVGDIFNMEIQDATKDLLTQMNVDLFTEQGLETQDKLIGLPYVTDSSTNTTLYGLTRSSTNLLTSNLIDGGSATITKAKLREAIRTSEENGASRENLLFVCSYTQKDLILGVYDSTQRQNDVSSRFGFEGMSQFDGVPIHADKDVDQTDEIYLVDLDCVRMAMQVPPTFEGLAKSDDSESGFVKTYLAAYYKAPNRLVEIYDLATS